MASIIPIFHTGRCGSTVLSDLLSRTPGVISDGEIISVNYRKHLAENPAADAAQFLQDRIAKRTRNTARVANYFFEIKFLSSVDAKHFPGGLRQIIGVLAEAGVKACVILGRANSLRRICSTLVALARGQYQARLGDEVVIPQVAVPVDSVWLMGGRNLLDTLQQIDDEYALLQSTLAEHGIAHLPISYENDIEADPKVAYQKVCNHFGIEPENISPAFKRINSRPLSDVMTNYDSVRAHLQGSRFEWMLESSLGNETNILPLNGSAAI